MQENWDESALVNRAKQGNLDAFNALILHYQTRVYNLAFYILHDRSAAEDATQDAFIAAFQSLGKFKGGSFRAWLLRIVTNLCYDQMRRFKRRPTIAWDEFGEMEEEANPHLMDKSPSPEQKMMQKDLRDILDTGLALLPKEQRLVIVLIDQMGCDYNEVVHITHAPLGTVKSRLYRARRCMRKYLAGQSENLPSKYRHKTQSEFTDIQKGKTTTWAPVQQSQYVTPD